MKTILLPVFLLSAVCCHAGMRRAPVPHAITSPGGHFVFTMIPGPKGSEHAKGRGICCKVMPDGSFKQMWKTEGWYSEDLELHYDGEVLARLGSWHSGDQDKGDARESLGVAFYKKGKLTRRYRITDLVKNEKELQHTSAGLWWIEYDFFDGPAFVPGKKVYQLVTVDRIRYRFDIDSGKIIENFKVKRKRGD